MQVAPDVQGRAGGVRALYFSPLKTYLVTYESLEPQKFQGEFAWFWFLWFGSLFWIGSFFSLKKWNGSQPYNPGIKENQHFLGPWCQWNWGHPFKPRVFSIIRFFGFQVPWVRNSHNDIPFFLFSRGQKAVWTHQCVASDCWAEEVGSTVPWECACALRVPGLGLKDYRDFSSKWKCNFWGISNGRQL